MSRTVTFEAMLARGQDSEMLRFTLGGEYLKEGDAGKAIEHLSRAVEMKPDYSAAWKLLGRALAAAQRYTDALGAFDSGLAVAAKNGDKQSEKEIGVFRRRVVKAIEAGASTGGADNSGVAGNGVAGNGAADGDVAD